MPAYFGSDLFCGLPDISDKVSKTNDNVINGANTFNGTTLVPTSTNTGTTDKNAVNVQYLYDQGYMTGTKAFPSSRYIDLTLGASGSTYTAPANGYYFIGYRSAGGANCFLNNINSQTAISFHEVRGYDAYTMMSLIIPVKKNDVESFAYYNLATPLDGTFRFVYADGEPS